MPARRSTFQTVECAKPVAPATNLGPQPVCRRPSQIACSSCGASRLGGGGGLEPERRRHAELGAQGPEEPLLEIGTFGPDLADDRAALDQAAAVDLDPELVRELREGAHDLLDLARVELRAFEDDEI